MLDAKMHLYLQVHLSALECNKNDIDSLKKKSKTINTIERQSSTHRKSASLPIINHTEWPTRRTRFRIGRYLATHRNVEINAHKRTTIMTVRLGLFEPLTHQQRRAMVVQAVATAQMCFRICIVEISI